MEFFLRLFLNFFNHRNNLAVFTDDPDFESIATLNGATYQYSTPSTDQLSFLKQNSCMLNLQLDINIFGFCLQVFDCKDNMFNYTGIVIYSHVNHIFSLDKFYMM